MLGAMLRGSLPQFQGQPSSVKLTIGGRAVLTCCTRHLQLDPMRHIERAHWFWPTLMSHIATSILDLIKTHPEWAVVLIAFTAFGESFLLVSLLFPGTAILVAAGGLIAGGILDPLRSLLPAFSVESWEMVRPSGWDRNSAPDYRNYGPSAGTSSEFKAASISSFGTAPSPSSLAVFSGRCGRRCPR